MSEKKGSFIVFEGIDGSGKTTQINLLKQKIEALNIKCLETREPSDGPIGVMIRQCLTGRMQMDEAALAEALNSGRIAGAGLDVLVHEPPKKDDPLLTAQNCIVTPHIAWASRDARARLIKTVAENLKAFRNGTPQNVVS